MGPLEGQAVRPEAADDGVAVRRARGAHRRLKPRRQQQRQTLQQRTAQLHRPDHGAPRPRGGHVRVCGRRCHGDAAEPCAALHDALRQPPACQLLSLPRRHRPGRRIRALGRARHAGGAGIVEKARLLPRPGDDGGDRRKGVEGGRGALQFARQAQAEGDRAQARAVGQGSLLPGRGNAGPLLLRAGCDGCGERDGGDGRPVAHHRGLIHRGGRQQAGASAQGGAPSGGHPIRSLLAYRREGGQGAPAARAGGLLRAVDQRAGREPGREGAAAHVQRAIWYGERLFISQGPTCGQRPLPQEAVAHRRAGHGAHPLPARLAPDGAADAAVPQGEWREAARMEQEADRPADLVHDEHRLPGHIGGPPRRPVIPAQAALRAPDALPAIPGPRRAGVHGQGGPVPHLQAGGAR